jgi:hypothetical protein
VPADLPLIPNAHRKTNRRQNPNEKDHSDNRASRSCHAAFRTGSKQTGTGKIPTNLVPTDLPLVQDIHRKQTGDKSK